MESFLTAPYGMIREIDKNGFFVTAPAGGNQRYFPAKIEMNEGVKDFIADFIRSFKPLPPPDPLFVDAYYGLCFDGCIKLRDSVKATFYNDNAMMNRFDSPLFC